MSRRRVAVARAAAAADASPAARAARWSAGSGSAASCMQVASPSGGRHLVDVLGADRELLARAACASTRGISGTTSSRTTVAKRALAQLLLDRLRAGPRPAPRCAATSALRVTRKGCDSSELHAREEAVEVLRRSPSSSGDEAQRVRAAGSSAAGCGGTLTRAKRISAVVRVRGPRPPARATGWR